MKSDQEYVIKISDDCTMSYVAIATFQVKRKILSYEIESIKLSHHLIAKCLTEDIKIIHMIEQIKSKITNETVQEYVNNIDDSAE